MELHMRKGKFTTERRHDAKMRKKDGEDVESIESIPRFSKGLENLNPGTFGIENEFEHF